jgi:hypothetical protein
MPKHKKRGGKRVANRVGNVSLGLRVVVSVRKPRVSGLGCRPRLDNYGLTHLGLGPDNAICKAVTTAYLIQMYKCIKYAVSYFRISTA